MVYHKLFLWLFLLDLTINPILAFFDIGLAMDFRSNYFARFFYIIALIIASLYLINVTKKIPNCFINKLFSIALVVGSLNGIYNNTIINLTQSGNPAFLSHTFYLLMPIVMTSYGYYFFKDFDSSIKLKKILKNIIYISFYIGIVIAILFSIVYRSGLSDYDAIGIWNFFYSSPYLLYQKWGQFLFLVSILSTIVLGKRALLVVSFFYLLTRLFLFKLNKKLVYFIFLIALFSSLILFFKGSLIQGFTRFASVIDISKEVNLEIFDLATAGRVSEVQSAIEYLSTSFKNIIFGAGFGAQYYPWPNKVDYENYISHYTHFSFVSYFFVAGIWFPISLISYFIYLIKNLIQKTKENIIPTEYSYFLFWLIGIFVISLFGAVLMNNSFLWFIIGSCIFINQKYTKRKNRLLNL